ncbi:MULTISPECIES: DNA cytosine methyltransferase [Delftia]|uniref:DNA (cytosine-5-)-methyltransferase n=1 Tax=Delftia lacustris TaxID=558537 RepID=A0A7T2YU43_9BURK|nr:MULTISPECIES: DNA cytosine methyltransferase [Delftia]EPD34422.1 DNA (cytosine-5-)-methyltransferase [Delftia acidovorans CCUG 15835]QPS81640.1 DNA cytosine methyltransferase [Delftia lacustris]
MANAPPITLGSVCSGIEAASVALGPLGFVPAWLSEIDPFASAVLAHHYPAVPNLGDMTAIARRVLSGEVSAPDVLCGGTPCQAFSVAGLRNSLADARGNLTLKFVELADAIDHVRLAAGKPPAGILWENVPGVLSTKDNAFGCFLAGLAGEDEPLQPPGGRWANAGAVYGPARSVAWRTLDAQYFGVAQRRRRVFVIASARNGFDPAAVLFEWDGMRRDTAPSREAGQKPAGSLTASAGRRGGVNDPERGQLVDTVATIDASFGRLQGASGQDANHGHSHLIPQITHTLRGEGFDDSEDGTGRGTPLIPVAFDTTQITSAANYSSPKPGDPCHPLAAGAHAPTIAFPARMSATQHASAENLSPALGATNPTAVAVQASQSGVRMNETVGTLDVNYGSRRHNGVMLGAQVRRLTPTECERLQGFPDGYTAIPWRGKPSDACPDGPRYKALGNSWPVPVVRWIGARLARALRN